MREVVGVKAVIVAMIAKRKKRVRYIVVGFVRWNWRV